MILTRKLVYTLSCRRSQRSQKDYVRWFHRKALIHLWRQKGGGECRDFVRPVVRYAESFLQFAKKSGVDVEDVEDIAKQNDFELTQVAVDINMHTSDYEHCSRRQGYSTDDGRESRHLVPDDVVNYWFPRRQGCSKEDEGEGGYSDLESNRSERSNLHSNKTHDSECQYDIIDHFAYLGVQHFFPEMFVDDVDINNAEGQARLCAMCSRLLKLVESKIGAPVNCTNLRSSAAVFTPGDVSAASKNDDWDDEASGDENPKWRCGHYVEGVRCFQCHPVPINCPVCMHGSHRGEVFPFRSCTLQVALCEVQPNVHLA